MSEVQKKTKQKKTNNVLHAKKHRICTQKMLKSKYTQKIIQRYRILEYTQYFVLDR